jgi:sugar phosphate isomerase/epimerase
MHPPSRVSFSTLAFPDATLASAVSFGRRWGYAGVELRLIDGELIDPSMPAADRARVKRALAGLPVVAVDSSIRLTDDDSGAPLRRFLELASDWEAPLVRVFGGALPGGPDARTPRTQRTRWDRRDRLRAAARVLEASVPVARRLGVAIGVETHDDFSASSVVAELLAMADSEGADPEWVGAVWDSHHPHRMGEQPADVYANLGRRILLAQVKDARRGHAGDWQLVLLGEGEVPVRQMLGLLAAGGYRNWISVEWEKRWHPEIEAPEVALPQYRRVLAEWMEVGP